MVKVFGPARKRGSSQRDNSEGEGKFKRGACVGFGVGPGQGRCGKTPRARTSSFRRTTKAEGGSVKAKLSRYRVAETLKNNLTPREVTGRLWLARTICGA